MKKFYFIIFLLLIARISYSQNPCPETPTVPYAGKTYNTVHIGSQCWLKENLDVGTRINGISEQTNNSQIEKYCYADQDTSCTKYGGLYQWAEAVQYQNGATNTTLTNPAFTGNVQGICPNGWHIPTNAEYTTLATTVKNDGNSLKAVGQGKGDGLGTNTSGFSALLSGYYIFNQTFNMPLDLGINTNFWSSTISNSSGYYLLIYGNNSMAKTFNQLSEFGFCVRCLND